MLDVLQLVYALTSIDHNAHHCLSVADGAAPQQQVTVMEANTNSIRMLPVKQQAHENQLDNQLIIFHCL